MTQLTFDQSLATQIYNSTHPYPIHIDDAWRWLGYTRKESCQSTVTTHFLQDIDFTVSTVKVSTGGRPRNDIHISIDCFKSLGMMSGTEQGKVIRKYFLECERIAKQAIAKQAIALQQQAPKALPSEYDLKLKNIRDRKNAVTKDIHELQIQIDELKGTWESLDAEEDILVTEKNKEIIDDGIRRRKKIENRTVRTEEETNAMYERVFGLEGK